MGLRSGEKQAISGMGKDSCKQVAEHRDSSLK